ncbi:MAG: hypothetical protein M3Q50_07910 [Chloroflexota bacterium]|nr:hypothetical protein [Chloroflexota bacterium]
MHPYDHHASRQRDAAARRDAGLNTVVDYRYLAPYKLAANQRWEREMARAALAPFRVRADFASARWRLFASVRRRLGTALIAAGTRL